MLGKKPFLPQKNSPDKIFSIEKKRIQGLICAIELMQGEGTYFSKIRRGGVGANLVLCLKMIKCFVLLMLINFECGNFIICCLFLLNIGALLFP